MAVIPSVHDATDQTSTFAALVVSQLKDSSASIRNENPQLWRTERRPIFEQIETWFVALDQVRLEGQLSQPALTV
jgi:isoleucyl-tRNA synthetase